MSFTHLHLHTEYSLLDGTIRIAELVAYMKEHGMTSCAITDHGNMYGAYKFYKALKSEGLHGIIGSEVYIAPRRLEDKEAGIDNKYNHMVLLAMNLQGYKNLLRIVSKGHIDGFYYKPRIDFEFLKEHSEGLIMLTACLDGVLAKPLSDGNFKDAEKNLKKYFEVFGDRMYIEVQRNGMDIQNKVNEGMIELARKYNIPIVATCDAHYLRKEDSELQEILWCVRDGKTLDDPTHAKLPTNEFYVKSPEEMQELFKDIPDAVENSMKIAERIEHFSLEFGRIEPHYLSLPEGTTSADYLRDLAYKGCEKRYGELTDALKARLDYELDVINGKGYNDYFLVVMDFVSFCHEKGIVVGMRGSGCGSAVAFSIGITSIEPIGWQLYFERFLNPERDSPPDFDIDIADRRRDEVIQYAIERYGLENVRQIGTFSKLQTRQAIRDISRVLGIDLQIADQLSKMVEIVFGKSKDINYMIEHNQEFKQIIESTPELMKMADIVRRISGLCRGVSTHACGILLTPTPVVDYVPIQRDAHGGGIGMSQYEMSDLEYVGLMKFDFLGLRNLSVIGNALAKIRRNTGESLDLMKIDPHDQKAFDIIRAGYTVGIFQMESEGMRKTTKMIKPDSLEEISYILAAYRPGPMQFIPEYAAVKDGEKEAEYLFPALKPILEVTNGVITYQEQVIKIAVDIAGYSMGAADILRRAMGKKKVEVMDAEKPKFIEGASSKGFEPADVEKLWEKLLQFANYGFNKAHSASYAQVTYWTAYLKAHYPLEFMASLLEGDLDNFDRVVVDLEECKRLGIQVFPPDINKSDYYFTIEDNKNIRFGLAAIKNVGEEIVKVIVRERKENGLFLNLDDFIFRMVEQKVQVKTIMYLIQVGTFDTFGERSALLSILESMYGKYKKEKEQSHFGQFDLFSGGGGQPKVHIEVATPIPVVEETPIFQKLTWEKELIGIYLSSHPLDNLEEFIREKKIKSIRDLKDMKDGNVALIAGLISKVRRITTKKSENMAILSVEDKTGSVDVVVFPKKYAELRDSFKPNVPMGMAGRVNHRDENVSLVLEKIKEIDLQKHGDTFTGVTFRVHTEHTDDDLKDLKDMIKNNSGTIPVRIIIDKPDDQKVMLLNCMVTKNETVIKYLSKFR